MKITYTPNPLCTIVELDEQELSENTTAAAVWLKNYRDEHFAQGGVGEDRH